MATDDNTITTENETVIAEEEESIDVEEDRLVYSDDSENLVGEFYKSEEGKKDLGKIAGDIDDKYTKALELSKDYRDRFTNDYALLMCELEKKSFPWPDCANVNVPITLEGAMRLWSRFYGQIFGDWSRVVAYRPSGTDDEPFQDLLTEHTNWQMREEIKDFRRQMSRATYLFLWGDVSCHSYRDPVTDSNVHEVLTCDDLIRPYTHRSVKPDYSDLPWIAKRLSREKHEMERMEGEYHAETLAKVLKKPPAYGDQSEGRELHDKAEGIQGERKPLDDRAPFNLIHWEGWLTLPQQVRQRFCQIHMDLGSRLILKLKIHEEPDWKEQERFDRETREAQMFKQETMQYEQMKQQMQMQMQQAEQMQQQTQVPGLPAPPPAPVPQLPPPPPEPIWMQEGATEPAPMKKSPIYMFRHAVCIEPLVGNLGIGLGRVLAEYNRAGNTLMNQFVDSATAANVKSWIFDENLKFDDGPPVMSPGRANMARLGGMKLSDHIHEFSPSPANPQMVDAVKMVEAWAQSAGQTPDILGGAPGKSGETWRGVSTRVEQATKQIAAISTGFVEFVEGIYENNGRLNAKFMPPSELFWVNDDMVNSAGQLKDGGGRTATREMYIRKMRFTVTADQKFVSEAQKTAEADELVMNLLQLAGAQIVPPQLLWPMIREAVKESFAARGKYNLIKILPPGDMPMPQPQPPGQQQPKGPSGPGGTPPTGGPGRIARPV